MPRQAAVAVGFATGTNGTRMLLRPPEDLNQLERVEFANLITGAPANHFLPSDVPLLAAYAKAIVAERVASGELAAAYVVDDRPSPWLPIWQAKVRALTTLARMLSLTKSGRSRGVEARRVARTGQLLQQTRSGAA